MLAALYLRVSSRRQVDNLSIPTQLAACASWCERKGLEVGRVFIDEAQSAKTANRPEFKKLLRYCRDNQDEVSCIVVYEGLRFSREAADYFPIRKKLDSWGVALKSATQEYDDSPAGRLAAANLIIHGQFDNEIKSLRSIAGMRFAVEERGRWVFFAPLGYLNTGEGRQKTIVPDPERAPIMRAVFKRLATGSHTPAETLRWALSQGLQSARGGTICRQSWSKLLRNPIYKGRVVVSKWGVDVEGEFEALIDATTFARAQRALDRLNVQPARKLVDRPEFPLRRFCRCGDCGIGMTGGFSKGRSARYGYYRCWKCQKVSIRRHKMHEEFGALVDDLAPSPVFLQEVEHALRLQWRERTSEVREAEARLGAQLRRLKNKRAGLVEKYGLGDALTEDDFKRLRSKLDRDIHASEARLADLAADDREINLADLMTFARDLLGHPYRNWERMSLDLKRRFQDLMFPEGLIYRKEGGLGTAASSIIFREMWKMRGKPPLIDETSLGTAEVQSLEWVAGIVPQDEEVVAHSGPTLNRSTDDDDEEDGEGDGVAVADSFGAFLGRLRSFQAALSASGESLE